MLKLSIEEREALFEMSDSDGYKILVNRVIPQLLEANASKVLGASLDNSEIAHNLLVDTAKLQGAKELAGKLGTLKQYLKKPQGN